MQVIWCIIASTMLLSVRNMAEDIYIYFLFIFIDTVLCLIQVCDSLTVAYSMVPRHHIIAVTLRVACVSLHT